MKIARNPERTQWQVIVTSVVNFVGIALALIREKKYTARKIARPISLRGANHLVMKSKRPTLRRHQPVIRQIIRVTQDRFGVKIRALAVMSDHVHLVIKVGSRAQFANALRFLAGQIAQMVSGTKLWRARAWSRPLKTLGELHTVDTYVARNPIKAGIYSQRDGFYIVEGVLQL
ncbi:MAG: transposase [Deltaproteobacteria bacterium]|nr:transposase [Deltaproteobacteria bacterium]